MDKNHKNENLVRSNRFKKKVLYDWISIVKKLNIIKMKLSGVKTEKIMKKFGVTNSEVSIIMKNRNKYKKLKKGFFSPFSKMKTLMAMSVKYKKLERRLLIWVRKLKNQGLPLDKSIFKRKAMNWYKDMGPSYPFRACNRWVRYFEKTHKIKVTFERNKNEQEEDKSVQIKSKSEIKDNQSETKDEKTTVSDQEATVNERNEKKKEVEKEKEEFFSKLFLLSNQNGPVFDEETDEQGIQMDVEWKKNNEIKVKMVETLNHPIFEKNVENCMNKDDAEPTISITDNQVFPFGIIKYKNEFLAHDSNESLINVFDRSNDEEKEEFLSELFLSSKQNETILREEMDEQDIHKDGKLKKNEGIVTAVEFLDEPIFPINAESFMNKDDPETIAPITGNQVFPLGIVEDRKKENKLLAHESNESLMYVFEHSNDLNSEEKEEFLSELFLFSNQNETVIHEETNEQDIQKDEEWKKSEGTIVTAVELLNQPTFPTTAECFMNKDDAENKNEEKELLAHESNESLMHVFDHSNNLDGKEKEKEFVRNQCDFASNSENSTKNVNNENDEYLNSSLQNSRVPKKLKVESKQKQSNSTLKKEFEQRLLKWLKNERKKGITVTNETFKDIALKYHKQFSFTNYFKADDKWLSYFKRRYNIKISPGRTRRYLSRNSKIKKEKMNQNIKSNEVDVKTEEHKRGSKRVRGLMNILISQQKQKLDKHLLNWLSEMESRSRIINGRMFQKKALELYKSLGHNYHFTASYSWIYSFEKRYQASIIHYFDKSNSNKHQLNDLDSSEDSSMSNETNLLLCQQVETETKEDCEKEEQNKTQNRDGENEKILEMQRQKHDNGESNSSEDKNCDTEFNPLTTKSGVEFNVKVNAIEEKTGDKPSFLDSFDYEDISDDCELGSAGDSVLDPSPSSCSNCEVNNMRIKEYLELFNKGLIQEEREEEEKVGRGVEDDWKEEQDEIAGDEGEYREDYKQQELEDVEQKEDKEEEGGESQQEKNFNSEDSEVKETEISECGIREVNVKEEEEDNVIEYDEKKIGEEKECKEGRKNDERVGAKQDRNNDSLLYNLLIRLDVSKKLISDKPKEERIVDVEKQADVNDKKEDENLTGKQVIVKEENLAMDGEDREEDLEEVWLEENEDDDLSSCGLLIHPNVPEKLIVNETQKGKTADEEKVIEDKDTKFATIGVIVEEIEEIVEEFIEIEYNEELSEENEMELDEKDIVTIAEEDQETIGEEEQNDKIEEVYDKVEEEENIEKKGRNLEIEIINEEIKEQEEVIYLKQKKKRSKHVTFAADVEIMNVPYLPADCSSIQPLSIMKPVTTKSIKTKRYSEILEYKLIFGKCKQFVNDQILRKYFKRQQITEFQQALDTLIEKATSENNLLNHLLMKKSWAPFGQMLCSEDIAWVFEGKIICTFCYKDDKDKYKNYGKSSIDHKLTSNKKLRGRICDRCERSTFDFRPAAKCIECIIQFWRGKSYYKLLFCNETGNLGLSSEQLLLTNSILTNIHDLEY